MPMPARGYRIVKRARTITAVRRRQRVICRLCEDASIFNKHRRYFMNSRISAEEVSALAPSVIFQWRATFSRDTHEALRVRDVGTF